MQRLMASNKPPLLVPLAMATVAFGIDQTVGN